MTPTKDNKPPKKIQRSKKKTASKNSPSVQIGSDVKNTNIITGDNNRITTTHNDNRVKNITNVFKNASPRDFILYTSLFLIALASIFSLFWYNNLRYNRAIASGQINILIVPFLEEKPWGYVNSDLGWNVAQIFADGLRASVVSVDTKILGPSDKVPEIFAFTGRQLENSVETIAEKINGQIVVYGLISYDEYGDAHISVQLYISPTNFGEAQELLSDEMMGDLSLGSIRLTGNVVDGADLSAQNKELRDRLEVFTHVINFLGAYIAGDFELAQEYITKASNQDLWSNPKGLEVIYLLHGNMEILYTKTTLKDKDLEATLAALENARSYFKKAEETSVSNGYGTYARAYLGLAGLESLAANAESNIMNNSSLIDTDALEQAIDYLNQAEKADYQPDTADIDVKVKYNKAQVAISYFLKTDNETYLNDAKTYYQQIVDEYKSENNGRISEYAASSYSGLGHIAFHFAEYEDAAEHFLNAQDITSSPSLKAQWLADIGDAYFSMQEYDKALKYYQDALLRETDLAKAVSAKRIEEIKERIDAIKSAGSS